MTTDIDAMAREIAATLNNDFVGIDDDGNPFLFKLDAVLIIAAALHRVRYETLEEAAKVADERWHIWARAWNNSEPVTREKNVNHLMDETEAIATAIRALKASTG